MPSLHHITIHIKRYGLNHKALYALSFMLLFWGIFDGIISYITPLIITQNGFSKTQMGIIIGTSSVAGAFFDLTICRFLAKKHYRRLFLYLLLICSIYPLILFKANNFTLYIIAMILWGLYYDIKNIARFDFMARRTKGHERSSSFGVNQAFISLGYLLAPLLAGLTIGEIIGWQPFLLSWIFVLFAIFFYVVLLFTTKRDTSWQNTESESEAKKNLLLDFHSLKEVSTILFPVLILTLCLNIFDSFFWTIGPFIGEKYNTFGHFGGLVLVIYQFPILILGWFVGSFTYKYGKKKTAILSFFIGSLIISLLFLNENFIFVLLTVFFASSALSVSVPSINGAYADYLDETDNYVSEIASLEDFCANLGYVVGPILAGFLANKYGEFNAFSIMGLFGMIIAVILLLKMPRKINIDRAIKQKIS